MMRRWFPLFLAGLAVGATAFAWNAVAQERGPAAPGQPARAPQPADPTRRDLSVYRLRVGDQIEVTVHKPDSFENTIERTFPVPPNGEISFTPIGRLMLRDRTAAEIEEVIAQRLKDQNFLTNPNVGVLVVKYAPRTVSVIGAVRKSVELPVAQDLRILELLAHVGGLDAPDADFSRVEIRRVAADGHVFKYPVNVDAVFEGTDDQQNVVVREGDIVKVPRLEYATPQSSEFVYVLGKVNQRGRIPMIRGRRAFTLVQLIALCGDFQEFADRSKVKIIRTTETGRRADVVDFDDIIEGKRPDYDLRPDDLIYVPESFL